MVLTKNRFLVLDFIFDAINVPELFIDNDDVCE